MVLYIFNTSNYFQRWLLPFLPFLYACTVYNITLLLFPLREQIYSSTPEIWFDFSLANGIFASVLWEAWKCALMGLVFSCFWESCPHMNKPVFASWRRRDHKDRDPVCLPHPCEGLRQGSEILLDYLASAKPTQTSSAAKLTHNCDKCFQLCFRVTCYKAKANSYRIYSLLEWFSFLIYCKSLESQVPIQSRYLVLRICLYLSDRINCSW